MLYTISTWMEQIDCIYDSLQTNKPCQQKLVYGICKAWVWPFYHGYSADDAIIPGSNQ